MDNGHSPVGHGVQLIQAAGLEAAGHEQHVRARGDAMRQGHIEAHPAAALLVPPGLHLPVVTAERPHAVRAADGSPGTWQCWCFLGDPPALCDGCCAWTSDTPADCRDGAIPLYAGNDAGPALLHTASRSPGTGASRPAGWAAPPCLSAIAHTTAFRSLVRAGFHMKHMVASVVHLGHFSQYSRREPSRISCTPSLISQSDCHCCV